MDGPGIGTARALLGRAQEILAQALDPTPEHLPLPERVDLPRTVPVLDTLYLFYTAISQEAGIEHRSSDLEHKLLLFCLPCFDLTSLLAEQSAVTWLLAHGIDPLALEWLQGRCDALGPPLYLLNARERRDILRDWIFEQLMHLRPEQYRADDDKE